jgi:hypothetical protein
MNKAKSWENDAVLFARTCTDLASLVELNDKAEQLPACPFFVSDLEDVLIKGST